MSAITVVCFVVAAIAFIDAVRRPASAWVASGRSRFTWLVVIVFLNAFGAVLYSIFVLPRLVAGRQQTDTAFIKQP